MITVDRVTAVRSTELLVAQLVSVAAAMVLYAAGSSRYVCVTVAIIVAIAALVRWRGVSATGRAVRSGIYCARRTRSPGARFARTVLAVNHDGGSIAAVWNGSDVSMVAELHPDSTASWSTVGTAGTTTGIVPLRELARCIERASESSFELGIVSCGRRPDPHGPASRVYTDMAGPLASVAHRRTWLVLSTDVFVGDRAAARRGGGLAGTVQSTAVQLSRLRHILRTASITAIPLTREALLDAESELTAGSSVDRRREHWSFAEVGGYRWRSSRLDPRRWSSATVDSVFDTPASATVLSARLIPAPDGVLVASSFSHRDTRAPGRAVRGGCTADGDQMAAFDCALPTSPRSRGPYDWIDPALLGELRIPVAGLGQILGVDDVGSAVTARLYGPTIGAVRVVAEVYVVHQIVFRAIAIGARVLVMTDRPHAWRHLSGAIADTSVLSVVTPAYPVDRTSPPDIVVADNHTDMPIPVRTTVVTVASREEGVSNADVVVTQPECIGDTIRLTIGRESVRVRLITTPAETEAIGRPRMPTRAYDRSGYGPPSGPAHHAN